MPQKMDGTDGQTMDQLGLGGVLDSNTMDFIELNIGKNNTSNPNKGKLSTTNEIITSKPKKGKLSTTNEIITSKPKKGKLTFQ